MSTELITTDAAWAPFRHLFHREEVKGKTVLLREGDTARKAYYIEKGSLRLWFNKDGRDVSFQFFFEGEGVSSIESFRTSQPSLFTIESIEPCVLHTIDRNDFMRILDESPAIKAQVEEHIFLRLVYYQQLFLSRIKDNPQQRYAALLANYPQLLQRVPQHYIASFLGISPVSLSRIRNRG